MIASPQRVLRKYTVPARAGGPRARLAIIWVIALMAVLLAGSLAVTVLFGAVGSIAGLQIAAAWRRRRVKVNQFVAGAAPALMALGAWSSVRGAAAASLAVALAALALGADGQISKASLSIGSLRGNLPIAAATLRSGWFVGLAVAAVVQVHRVDAMSFLFLASIVCVYDAGDYLVGSGVRNRLVGPIAGFVGVIAVVFAMTAINPPPLLVDSDVRVLGALVGLACPLGQMLGSWLLPSTRTPAPALRRLDSWLIAAPVCLVGLWIVT